MVTNTFYLPAKAAELLGVSEEQVRLLIETGKLRAEYRENLANFVISHNDVISFLKTSKDFKTIQKVLSHRVLVVDRDPAFQDLIRMELQRRANVQVRVATSERDVALQAEEFLPDLILVHAGALVRQSDRVVEILASAKVRRRIAVVVYHNFPPGMIEEQKATQEGIRRLEPEEVLSVHQGTRPLMEAISRRLGLR